MTVSKNILLPSHKGPPSPARQIVPHNVPIIGVDMNAQIGKKRNNTFSLHKLPN